MAGAKGQPDRVRIQAVAKHAGVSVMTVSNVTNNLPIVKPATRERVLASIQELGYVPSQTARRLKRALASRIGVFYFDHDLAMMDSAIAAISVAAADRGLQLIMRKAASARPSGLCIETLQTEIEALVRSGAEALLLFSPLAELLAISPLIDVLDLPIAAIETATPLKGIATFRIDDRGAARAITNVLIKSGRRRIAAITGSMDLTISQERYKGHCDALSAAHIEIEDDLCFEGDFSFQSGLAAAEQIFALEPRPDAIVAASDDMAAAVMLTAHRLSIQMPSELAITGFDDSLIATRVWPTLTTVRQPLALMARQAIDHLTSAVRQKGPCDVDVIFDYEVINRDST